jgi:hypothetical protein
MHGAYEAIVSMSLPIVIATAFASRWDGAKVIVVNEVQPFRERRSLIIPKYFSVLFRKLTLADDRCMYSLSFRYYSNSRKVKLIAYQVTK